MSFIQNLFTSRDNNAEGNTFVGQQDRIWWNPDTNAFYYSDGNTAGGILITGGSSGNGTVGGLNTQVQFNNSGNFGGDPNFTFNSSTSTLTVTNIVTTGPITGGAGGSNTQVLLNDSGNIAGNAQFTFNKVTNTLTQPGTAVLGNILAAANNISNIGSSTNRFYDLWLGSGNINLIDDTLNINQQINAVDGNLVITGGNGLKFGQFAIYGNTISTINPAANINIGLAGSTGYVDIERPVAINSTGGGAPAFLVEQNGTVSIFTYGNVAANTGALLINGSASGNDQPRNFGGTMIQITAQDNTPARMAADAFGIDGSGQNAYVNWAARVARGTVDAPSQTQASDLMFRFASQGYSNSGAYIPNVVRYSQVALENFATGKAGTRHNFAATPVGSATIKNIANIDANGITFSSAAAGGPGNIGITFQDGSYQNTAYIPTSVVSSLTAGAGISLSSSTGNITIASTGVLGVNGTTNQINVANVGNVLTLSLPQNLNTTANIQLNQLTVNDLIILGNVSNVIPSVVGGKIIYVANTATNFAGIDVSGIVTGNVANGVYAGMLYNTTSNTWVMDIGNSVGITSDQIFATNIIANANLHLGNASNDYDFPNALLQGDVNVDTYGQFVLKNHSQTANASADIVAVANNGDDSGYYIDMGINSNVYSNVGYTVTGPNDGYLYVNGGNLVIGTQTTAKVIKFFTDGTDNVSNVRMTVNSTGLSVVGNVTANNMISTNATIGGTVSAAGNITGGNLLAPAGILSVSGNITGLNVNTTIVSATGNVRGGNINTTGIVSATGNIVGGNLTTGAQVVATGNVTGGNIITSGAVSATGAVLAIGNVTGGNVNTGGNVIVSGLVSAVGNVIGGNLVGQNLTAGRVAIVGSGKEVSDDAEFTYNSTTNVLSVAGNVNAANFNGNVVSTGNISTTGNVTGNYFIGNGSQLTGVITTITPNALSSTVHIAATTVGNTANIITDATTANTANTIVVRDANGSINVNGWVINARTTATSTTLTSTDFWLGTSTKNLTITLPNAANGAVNGRQYQIADEVHSGSPGTTIAAQSPATAVGNQPSQQGQIIVATYVGTTWYLN
jgi:hypothetical protein